MTNVRAVFFDLDGTIVASIPAHSRAWHQILGEIGITLSDLYIELHEGEKAEETVARLLRENGVAMTAAEQHAMIERKRALYRTMAPAGLMPEARELIDALLGQGIECDIVTGSARSNILGVLPEEEINLFRHIVSADDYACGKPAPDPYLTALARAGFAAEECLVLENAPLGIQSAKAAGLVTAAITTTLPPEYLAGADYVISSHTELLQLMRP